MGWTMKGMAPSPRPVTAHFRRVSATAGSARARPYRDTAHRRLMKNPAHAAYAHFRLGINQVLQNIPKYTKHNVYQTHTTAKNDHNRQIITIGKFCRKPEEYLKQFRIRTRNNRKENHKNDLAVVCRKTTIFAGNKLIQFWTVESGNHIFRVVININFRIKIKEKKTLSELWSSVSG